MLACRGRRLKLLNIELSKAGVPGIFELISIFRPAMERVDEYPRDLVGGRLPVATRSPIGEDSIACSFFLARGV